MKDEKSIELSLVRHFRLSKTMGPQTEVKVQKMERVSYAFGVGSLIYTMVCCRPNISHAVSQVSKFMAQSGKEH